MELALLVYLLGMLKAINAALWVTIVVSAIAIFIFVMIADVNGHEESWKFAKQSAMVFFSAVALTILLPSERTGYVMVGAYATQKIATDERTSAIGNKVYMLIDNKLQEFINETTKSEHNGQ